MNKDATDPFINKHRIDSSSTGELSRLSFAIKDNIDIAGEMTGYGSPGWLNTHPEPVVNAICLEQLLNAGGGLAKAKQNQTNWLIA